MSNIQSMIQREVSRQITPLKNMLRNTVRRSLVTLEGNDDKDFPIQQISYLGKAADCEIITPYGVHANLPANEETLVTMWSVSGQEDYRLGMGYTPKLRPKNLPEGEVVFYHPTAKSRIQFKNNGDIEIDATGDNGSVIVTIKKDLNITVAGDATVTIAGDASIDITGIATVTCPTTNWTGDINLTGSLDITGNLDVSGSTTLSSTVTSGGKDISDTHTHVGSPTAPSGSISNTGEVN